MEKKPTLEERVDYLEKRVRYLEEKLYVTKSSTPIKQAPPSLSVTSTEDAPKIEWDVLIFQKILPRLFIFVLIIGILWGFKAASDYGFLTNAVKIIIGFLTASALIIFGLLQLKKSRTILGQVLLGGAIPVLMLTTFAMHQLYGMTGPTISFLLNIIWIGLGVYFTYQYRSQSIGIVSAIGGVFVPFLIASTTPNIPVFVMYETLLYLVFIWIALTYRYTALYFFSGIFLHLSLLIFFNFASVANEYKWIAVSPILFQQFALLIGFVRTDFHLKRQAYTLFASVLFTSLWISIILTTSESSIIFILLALLYGISYYLYRSDSMRAPIFIANTFISLLLLTLIHSSHFAYEVLVGSSLIYLYLAKKYKSKFHYFLAGFQYLIAFIIIISLPIHSWISWRMLHWIVFLAATGFSLYYLSTLKKGNKRILHIGFPYFALLLLTFTSNLSALITGVEGIGRTEPIVLSVLWIVIAIGFMLVGKSRSIIQGKYVGVGVLFITLGKIILIDIHFVSIAVRAALFILLGLVGLIVSRAYYK
ncbi:DUF2339 domain-containing protein [Bacillus sp. FJAT-50079]|uniref:DUF2339 domain-containing protein n=1 Tax=Bacillus sp. FJAT-50079 TaxID=2833577 RepID=UPI001BC92246|nr:DUF2339 domain-containing protein [Bacillus sp. FJAT-50079]MBS4209556.1 DUF2339 domain-containing protein [Bacillus sp. FJAT-50079]